MNIITLAISDIFMYTSINNKRIYYKRYNYESVSGLPSHTLVFLHEGLGSVEQWKDFPESICSKLNLPGIAYDRFGHGKSDPLLKKRTPGYLHEEAIEYLPILMENLNISNPIFIGHSDGGTIALLYASRFHGSVTGIITEAAHVIVEERTLNGIRKFVEIFRETSLKDKLAKYHGEKTEELFYSWAYIWLSAEFRNWNITEEIRSVKSPLLVIQGENDEYGTPLQLEIIKKQVAGYCEKLLIPNCGHTPHLQARETVGEKIEKFISSRVSMRIDS